MPEPDVQRDRLARALLGLRVAEDEETPLFSAFIEAAGLDPATDFQDRNFDDVDFGEDDLSHVDFSGSSFKGALVGAAAFNETADLSAANAVRQLSEDDVREMILRGETPDPRACEFVFRIDLNGTKISDLAPLKTLANLRSLDLHNTQVADLTPVRHVPDIWGATAEAYATIGRDAKGRPIER
ncbi:MAG: leucine-rich repeat domain-containing protein [Maricaulaceae bacterium]